MLLLGRVAVPALPLAPTRLVLQVLLDPCPHSVVHHHHHRHSSAGRRRHPRVQCLALHLLLAVVGVDQRLLARVVLVVTHHWHQQMQQVAP